MASIPWLMRSARYLNKDGFLSSDFAEREREEWGFKWSLR
jgi:hypothetical protein